MDGEQAWKQGFSREFSVQRSSWVSILNIQLDLSFEIGRNSDMGVSLEREARERKSMVDFIPMSFGGSAIYHRVWNGEMRPMMVSVLGLVVGKF